MISSEPPLSLPARAKAVADSPPRAAWRLKSFWMAGFEGADHINTHGEPLDMVQASGHVEHLDADYANLAAMGLRSVRESVGWRLSERADGFDFSRAVRIAQAARRHGVQVLWTLMHYGTPSDVGLTDPALGARFARFARAAAQALAPWVDEVPIYTPINEIGFLAWAAAQTRLIHPYGSEAPDGERRDGSSLHSGFQIKCGLVHAAISAMHAIREVNPRARFMHAEPLVHVVAPAGQPELAAAAAEVRGYQWQAWDMLAGRLMPELGGSADALDIVGVNHYHSGQWEVHTERRLQWHPERHLCDPRRLPFSCLLEEAWQRYQRPIVVSETSHFGTGRAQWLDEMATQASQALVAGVDLRGLCLYPIVDRPDWNDSSHWHNSGLWDRHARPEVAWPRRIHLSCAKTLRRWQCRMPK